MEFAEQLRALMGERGVSGTELARRAHFSKGYVSLLVNGKRHPPVPTARHLDEILGGGGILTALAARRMRQQGMPAGETLWPLGDEDEDNVRRRELLRALGGAVAGAGFAELERLRRGVDAALSTVPSERDADAWERTAAGYAHEVGVLPSRDLLPGLLADFSEIGERLAGSSGHIRHRLARAAGQLAALTAIALTNLGDSATARRWWRTAARAADDAGDHRAAALVRGRQAVFSLYGSRPAATALSLAEEAIAAGRNAPCAGVASGYAARAQALAQLGRSQDARRALQDLTGVFERLPASVSADRWSAWGWSEMRLRHVESYVYTQAGDVRAASRAQDAALRLYPQTSYQGPAQVELHRAECLIRAGDIDGGAQHASQVLGKLPRTGATGLSLAPRGPRSVPSRRSTATDRRCAAPGNCSRRQGAAMSQPEAGLTFTRHDAESAAGIFDTVITPVYEASHADVISNPFYSTARFAERVRGYMRAPGFELVAAHTEGRPIGQAFGYTLQPGARWWHGLSTPVPEGFTDETGRRTFALNELMVEPQWQRRGIAHALHDELLSGRPEERATLLVRADNEAAQTAYARWGWQKVAKLRPFPDSPLFDALILPLPVRSPGAT